MAEQNPAQPQAEMKINPKSILEAEAARKAAEQLKSMPAKARMERAAVDVSPVEAELRKISGSNRASELSIKITPIFPIDGPDTNIDEEAAEASIILDRIEREERERNERAIAAVSNNFDFFVRCRKQHPRNMPSHGIYLKRCPMPGQLVKMNEWQAGYKKGFDSFWSGGILCQVCLRVSQGRDRVHLDVNRVGDLGEFYPAVRWLYARPRDPAILQEVGEFRCHDTGRPISDESRHEAILKLAKLGIFFDAQLTGVGR